MKRALLAFCLTTLAALGENYPLEEDRDMIADTLGKDWSVSVAGDAIEIKSKFMVYVVLLTSRVGETPDFKDSIPPRELSKIAEPEQCIIRLKYAQWPGNEKVQRQFLERQRLAALIEAGTQTKDEYAKRVDQFQKLRIPRYMGALGQYCVYREVPSTIGGSRIYPPAAVAKIGAAKELLDAIMPNLITNFTE